ncbi:MAG TPA: 3-deoxy-manno-octulosonate cytidylyltransferase [Candidatus Thermoplasmatota archaeon]|nr:3-deoxy-manno-octulosonate cytidylyltransferase [Candidatus Thermoplasmatota archaeon]
MRVVGIIPARMKSSRYPNKPFARIHGIPMIGHCFLRSKMSTVLDEVYVACCDREVFDYVTALGGKAVMTDPKHPMGSDRVAEAARKIEEESGRLDVVVNIQGDQPMVFPDMIDAVTRPLLDDPRVVCSTMVDEIADDAEFADPNRVKMVMDADWNAMYFSREPIPSRHKYDGAYPRYKHVALIPFRRDLLFEFGRLPMTALEKIESIDYLRLLENGHKIKVVLTKRKTETVDTTRDRDAVERMMVGDPLLPLYEKRARAVKVPFPEV